MNHVCIDCIRKAHAIVQWDRLTQAKPPCVCGCHIFASDIKAAQQRAQARQWVARGFAVGGVVAMIALGGPWLYQRWGEDICLRLGALMHYRQAADAGDLM